ncbi:MAG: LPXTG cell wall anchor domain-containing protein [Bacteroidales bacterium]
MKTRLLFPHRCKRIGWILLIPSTVLGILILFFDFKFDFMDSKLFTIYSQGFPGDHPVWFGLTGNGNYSPTIAGILFVLGAILVAFSKEKEEDEFIAKTRLESLVWATYINYAVLAICFLFFFNMEFLLVMIFNMFTILIFFIARFYYILYKSKKSLGHEK